MRMICLTASIIFALHASCAFAAPAGVLNKTITISFATTGMAKAPDGKSHGFTTKVSRIIYVSSAGRLFSRFRATNRGGDRSGEIAPGQGKGNFSFQGDKLVGVVPYEVGARQVTITFDTGYSSCSVNVIEGHTGGVIRRKAPNDVMYELSGVTTTSPSCSIQSGNAFAS